MKFTIEWLKEHLDTKLNDEKIINKLTNIGLEVESFENQKTELDQFVVAKIINSEKHPNADRLKLCEVDIGQDQNIKVVCGLCFGPNGYAYVKCKRSSYKKIS